MGNSLTNAINEAILRGRLVGAPVFNSNIFGKQLNLNELIIDTGEFKSNNVISPPSLPMTFRIDRSNDILTLFMKIDISETVITINIKNETIKIVSQNISGLKVNISIVNNKLNISILYVLLALDVNDLYDSGDTYLFNIDCDLTTNTNKLIAELTRQKGFDDDSSQLYNGKVVESTQIIQSNLSTVDNKLDIPIISILGQTTVNGNDIGNVIFKVFDTREYYDFNLYKKHNKCGKYTAKISDLKETKFDKCSNKIVSVFRGKGETLYDKIEYVYKKYGAEKIGTIHIKTFYKNVFLYAMIKYFLAKLIYEEFNLKYLTREYNEKFLEDLSRTRFCQAEILFTVKEGNEIYGYNKYFINKLC